MSNYKKLQEVLREIFEMDKADLDFGIYRIINQKRKEIDDFIGNKLPAEIKEILSQTSSRDTISLEKDLEELGKTLDAAGVARESSPKYLKLQKSIEGAMDMNAMEQEIFSHLSSFFKRYYKDGDFISLRRYKKDVYAIPYEGEEVKLHWANHDQYYIKTSEYLKNYSFKTKDGKRVHFQLKEASTEQNNNKTQGNEERRFSIYKDLPIEQEGNELFINFTYEPHKKSIKQTDLEKEAVKLIGENIPVDFVSIFAVGSAPTERNKTRTILEKHLTDFISRNTFDYFIHKDLGGFLSRELDFYIKNEVLYIDDIDIENTDYFVARLTQLKALKTVGRKIISFLTQLEEFQKKLWLKKKFVIRTDYCITLDRIPEEYYPEILENKEQLAAWIELYDVNIKSIEELKEEPFLMLDTQFYSEDFKDKLLAEFDDLDAQTDGILINSENFQALNLMQEKYKEEIDTVYIDPPYNTAASAISYKNEYKDSSWISLMNDRLQLSKRIMSTTSIISLAIDDEEVSKLRLLAKSLFNKQLGYAVIRSNPVGRKTTGRLTPVHEYNLFFGKSESSNLLPLDKEEGEGSKRYPYIDDIGRYSWLNFIRSGSNDLRTDSPTMYYPILVDQKDNIRIPNMKYISPTEGYEIIDKIKDDEEVVYPIKIESGEIIEKNWQRGWERMRNELNTMDEYRVRRVNSIINIDFKARMDSEAMPRTWWDKSKYASSNYGAMDMKNLFSSSNFTYPKSTFLVLDCIVSGGMKNNNTIALDYFAGSGTTGHAVVKLNREDDGNRKYIMVEMGTYFDTVTKPRMQKVVYSDNWKDGKPQDKEGISHMFKYQVLESYEDVLNNLKVEPQNLGELGFSEYAQEDYLLNYMMDLESRDHLFDLEIFKNPFNYQLKVTENNELIPTKVDLVETFNYLIGLYVYRMQKVGDIKFVEGTTREGEKTLVIWRNTETVSNDEVQRIFRKLYESQFTHEFDQIYINGDHNFQNFRKAQDSFKVKLIEEDFFKRMFEQ